MSEQPFQLIDDEELAFYLVMYELLKAQGQAIVGDPFLIEQAVFWETQAAAMYDALVPLINEFMANGAEIALGDLASAFVGSEAEFSQSVLTAARQNAASIIQGINETTMVRVNELIQQSIIENWSLDELTAQLMGDENLLGVFSEMRARLIAVTETTTAYLEGAEVAAIELRSQGYLVTIIWQTVNDLLVCSTCESRNGRAQGDGWSFAQAAHPGCRCFAILEATLIQ